MTFNAIRAFAVRPGDCLPVALPTGQWDKSRAVKVARTHKSAGMIVFTMTDGSTARAFPMNTVPFVPAR